MFYDQTTKMKDLCFQHCSKYKYNNYTKVYNVLCMQRDTTKLNLPPKIYYM